MVEGPRAIRIPVTHLGIGREWYRRALEREPDGEDGRSVVFTVGGCRLVLQLSEQPGEPSGAVYWAVDQLAAEHLRIATIGQEAGHAPPPVDPTASTAELRDPFGNVFGLIATDERQERQLREQRTAEKLALQNVRETLDRMQQKDADQKRINRIIGWALATVVLLALVFAWSLASQQRQAAEARPVLPIKAPGSP